MNKLKKLFSPSALAATVATGMLLHATVTLAGSVLCLSQSLVYEGIGLYCYPNNTCSSGGEWFWCCPAGDPCGPLINGAGWCYCPD
jgi:hypothetical protein